MTLRLVKFGSFFTCSRTCSSIASLIAVKSGINKIFLPHVHFITRRLCERKFFCPLSAFLVNVLAPAECNYNVQFMLPLMLVLSDTPREE